MYYTLHVTLRTSAINWKVLKLWSRTQVRGDSPIVRVRELKRTLDSYNKHTLHLWFYHFVTKLLFNRLILLENSPINPCYNLMRPVQMVSVLFNRKNKKFIYLFICLFNCTQFSIFRNSDLEGIESVQQVFTRHLLIHK